MGKPWKTIETNWGELGKRDGILLDLLGFCLTMVHCLVDWGAMKRVEHGNMSGDRFGELEFDHSLLLGCHLEWAKELLRH